MKKRFFIAALLTSALWLGCSDDTSSNDSTEEGKDQCAEGSCESGKDDKDPEKDPDKPKAVCGNGVIETGEVCDEGTNKTDGCAADCSAVADGWKCATAGQACVQELCGNGALDEGEACDEGANRTAGCAADCSAVTDGWICSKPNASCVLKSCGDGQLDVGEECDDGDENFAFPYGIRGGCLENCVLSPYCGDGRVDAEEQCDNGDEDNVVSGSDEDISGYNLCTSDCLLSEYACGNGKLSHDEVCDDGNRVDGDGCSSTCKLEAGYYCETPGLPCEKFKCGNGVLDAGESCDDSNRVDGDGCSSACQTEQGYLCLTAGAACEAITCSSPSGTTCNDGNTVSGDGCSDVCQIEPGWICPDGIHCYVAGCGDGIAVGSEDCDDGNHKSGDGCTEFCRIEAGFACPEKGGACHQTVCGDGVTEGDETCDEGVIDHPENATAGCINCMMQMGWKCDVAGTSCTTAECGNGIVEGAEECDEGTNQTEGCKACYIQTGWRCPTAGSACIKGECGDGEIDAGEQCDDGNLDAGDGCDPMCEREAIFSCPKTGECKPVCGDGVTMWMISEDSREECDDGNTLSGDGCSADCKIEKGWSCTDFEQAMPDYIEVPANYYDFRNWARTGTGDGYLTSEFINKVVASDSQCSGKLAAGRGFPDFQRYGGSGCDGMVYNELDSDGKPVLRTPMGYCTNIPSTAVASHLSCGGTYHYWYRYEPQVNRVVKSHLRLFLYNKEKSMYRFDSAAPCSDFKCGAGAIWAQTAAGENMPKGNFVPINKSGYCEGGCNEIDEGGFTSEVKTYFQYKGGEVLEFAGNDDVWVFLNNRLFVDIGGMQGSRTKSGTLKAEKFGDTGKNYDPDFHVYEGGVYSVTLFNAERMMTGSSFRLTLSGFVNAGSATCSAKCGDGIVVGNEECDIEGHTDDETARQAGCVNCVSTPYCPNGKREGNEECDGEAWCSDTCKFTDSTCGDGVTEGHEQCDAGANNGAPGSDCAVNCMKIGCGNGVLDAGEECDDGNEVNDDSCSNQCKRPFCGDGIPQSWRGEVCDDGINDGAYGHCGMNCAYRAPYCGDGIVQTDEGEECDRGELNTGAYGLCSKDCKLVERCGDGIVQPAFESCDDGPENGQPGKCPATCVDAIL